MRFCTWNVRSLYRSGSLSTVATELSARYKLDSVGVQDKVATVRAEDYTRILFLWERIGKSPIGNRIFIHHRIVSAVKKVEFVSDRTSSVLSSRCIISRF